MKTITLDILNDRAVDLLKDLEALNVIKVHDNNVNEEHSKQINRIKSLKGKMAQQSREEIDKQLNDLRNEWD